jgi:hypothetical protein
LANDNCADAVELTVSNSCSLSIFSNISATAEPPEVAPNPTCGLYKGGDVWFTVEMPLSGALRIETNNLAGSIQHSIVIYSGTCGDFNEIFCLQQDRGRTLYEPSLTGETLYIRVFSFNGIPGSSFEFCVWEPVIPDNDNCESSTELDVLSDCTIRLFSNQYATLQAENIAPEPSCGSYKGGDVWFNVVMPASGNLRIETNNLLSGTSKSVTAYTGSCGNFTEVFCNQLDDESNFFDPSLIGQTIYLRLYDFNTEEGGDFEICLHSPSAPSNDDCENAFEIEVGENCTAAVFSNAFATSQPATVAPVPSCGQFLGGDVWFKTVMPASGSLRIETNNLDGINAHSIVVYTGICNSMTEVFCNQLDGKKTFNDVSLAGQMLYIRMFTYANEEGGEFDLCAYKTNCEDIALDVDNVSVCEGDSFIFGNQILTEPGQYHELFTSTGGCDSLVNLTLDLSTTFSQTLIDNICSGDNFTFPDGLVLDNITSDTTYTSILPTLHGCDSIIINAIHVNTPDVSVTQLGTSLKANADNAAYQWINCDEPEIGLPGETGQTFAPESYGQYAVRITQNTCTAVSACFDVSIVTSLDDHVSSINLYPNPVSQVLNIELPDAYQQITLSLKDLNGKELMTKQALGASSVSFDMNTVPPGMYIVHVVSKGETNIIKIMKE